MTAKHKQQQKKDVWRWKQGHLLFNRIDLTASALWRANYQLCEGHKQHCLQGNGAENNPKIHLMLGIIIAPGEGQVVVEDHLKMRALLEVQQNPDLEL